MCVWKNAVSMPRKWRDCYRSPGGKFEDLLDYSFTARMEEQLDDIANAIRAGLTSSTDSTAGFGRAGRSRDQYA